MDFCFDSIIYNKEKLTVIGWATCSDRANRIKFYALDRKKNQLECSVTRACRPDVGLAKYRDTKAEDVGVFIEVPCRGVPYVELHLEETDNSGKIVESAAVPFTAALVAARRAYKITKKTLLDMRKDARNTAKKAINREYHAYNGWYHMMKISEGELEEQRNEKLEYRPKFSIVVPLYNTPLNYFHSMIASVKAQSYDNWQLVLVNASADDRALSECVARECLKDSRIITVKLDENKGISENTCAGIDAAEGEFIAFLDHDDVIEPDALYWYIKKLQAKPDTDLFYSDEDKIGEDEDDFMSPYFKPDFSPDLLCSNNYICHFLAVRASLLREVGGPRSEFDGAQDYDLILRLTEKTDNIYHCSRVLYHWRSHSNSTAASQGNKYYAIHAGARAITEHYRRIGINARAQIGALDGWYRTDFTLDKTPMVSILIPNKDHIDDLDVCIQSVLDRVTYPNYEIIVIENNSTEQETFDYYKKLEKDEPKVRVVYWEREFNYSAINNFGASFARGEYLLLLNNDVEVITPELISHMMGYGQRPEVGIVGAKLIYNDHTVQHAGVLVGASGLADHVFKGIHEDDPGYMGRAVAVQNVSAVTAACLLIRKSVYDEVGGLEEDFQVAFNDVDLCLKVRAAGYLIVYDADVKLYHYESKSRGSEDTPQRFIRFGNEMQLLNNKWDILGTFYDTYYNKNLSYVRYYKLNHDIEARRAEKFGKQETENGKKGNNSNSKLQWKKVLKKVLKVR